MPPPPLKKEVPDSTSRSRRITLEKPASFANAQETSNSRSSESDSFAASPVGSSPVPSTTISFPGIPGGASLSLEIITSLLLAGAGRERTLRAWQHFLSFIPLPQGQGSFRPGFLPLRSNCIVRGLARSAANSCSIVSSFSQAPSDQSAMSNGFDSSR